MKGKKLKGSNNFVKGHHTKQNSDILHNEQISKKGKISSTWTRDCIYILNAQVV